jgi:hypothetical protein
LVTPPQSPSEIVPTARGPGRPKKGPDVAGATALASTWSTYDRPGNYYLRSSPPQPTSAPPPPNVPKSGWHKYLQKTKEVFDDLTMVPPPGWKPPKAERDAWRAAQGPSPLANAARAVQQAARVLTRPPLQPETPPPQRKDTGTRPKQK